MANQAKRCAVVGAANIDIGGFPAGMAVMGDSNPGRIRMSAGGVGRNIACNLARMGVETHMITALGADGFAGVIREDCRRAGVDLDGALVFEDAASSAYLFIADAAGDMALAVNDMDICARLTPEALEGRIPMLNRMDAVVLDANLSPETLAFLASRVEVPVIADAVSAVKAPKLKPILPRLFAVKPNAMEAGALTGIPITDRASAEAAARALRAMGANRAFITMGERGVCCAGDGQTLFIPGEPVRMVNATGAGDAFTAALAWATLRELDLSQSALAGLAAASIAVEGVQTVNPDMSPSALENRIRRIGNQK